MANFDRVPLRGVAVISVASLLLVAAAPVRRAPLLGVVQELHLDNEDVIGVRVLFRLTKDGWQPVCTHLPARECEFPEANEDTTWDVWGIDAADGPLVTRGKMAPGWYWSVGMLRIVGGALPFHDTPSDDFSGWGGGLVHKPVVVTSGLNSGSAHDWRSIAPDASVAAFAWPVFAHKIPIVTVCDRTHQFNRSVSLKDIEFPRELLASDGGQLLHVSLSGAVTGACDGPIALQDNLWLYRSPDQVVRALPRQSGGIYLTPLAFGDFGNGSDAALFTYSGYDKDGYLMYDHQFSRVAEEFWMYQ